MNKKSTVTKSLSFLIVALLATTAFVREPWKIRAYLCAFSIFGIWILAVWLYRSKRHARFKPVIARHFRAVKVKVTRTPDTGGSSPELVLLRHVNYRISAYLQSAYPGVTWEWCNKTPEKIAAGGGTGRIRLSGVPDFNYAEITLDTQARISCELLRIVPLSAAQVSGASTTLKAPQPPQPVDPAVWYDIQGRGLLKTLVADLNSRGYSRLTIKENGDICVDEADGEAVKDRFNNLPGKPFWPGIVKVFENSGLTASASDKGILVSW